MSQEDLADCNYLNELKGKKIKVVFEIHSAQGLPKQLCSKTFAHYEFYKTKE